MRIDPHVHCRDGKQAYKTTIKEVLKIAKKQGVDVIIDMPNTDPPIVDEQGVEERLKLVPETEKQNYRLYVGLTGKHAQIKNALSCYQKFPEVVGLKMFAGHSVGALAVVEDDQQALVYLYLAEERYKGLVAVHCERENNMHDELWVPTEPITHSLARPKEAEVNSVHNQIQFAHNAGFEGTLHIPHVSCADTVSIIRVGRTALRPKFKITCGVAPHHLLFSTSNQANFGPLWGNMLKVNPPLRSHEDMMALRDCLAAGDIDMLETDHAQHSWAEKLSDFASAPSGIPSLFFYKRLVEEYLPAWGVKKHHIDALTCENVVKAFNPKLNYLF